MGTTCYTYGYSWYHHEVWFHRLWVIGNDTMHEYWWVKTLGLDGID